jgi:hypothetical protein
MRLSRKQLEEVDSYLYGLTKYRETFQELKDHVLSALRDLDASTFDLQLVKDIVDEDFGGQDHLLKYEALCMRSSTRQYLRLLGMEMLNTFKWSGLVRNLFVIWFCAMIYDGQKSVADISPLPVVQTMYIVFYLPGLFVLFHKFVALRHKKLSMLHNFLFKVWLLTATAGTFIIQGISFANKYLHYNSKFELGLILAMYVVMNIFLKAYMKLYKEKIRILAV